MTNQASEQAPDPTWLESQGQVIACKYRFGSMNTLTLGIPTDSNQFLITFTYYAQGETYSDQFTSPTYLEQGHVFPLLYNPQSPRQNTKSIASSSARSPLFAIAVAVSVVISIVYLASMRGCY